MAGPLRARQVPGCAARSGAPGLRDALVPAIVAPDGYGAGVMSSSESSLSDPMSAPELTDRQRSVADEVIARVAGAGAALRADQVLAVAALCAPPAAPDRGARVLVVQATGWGKSAVYWAATAIRRAEGHGPTLVVSPLLSLMRDQVAAARKAGLVAATLNSSNIDDWDLIEAELADGRIDVLLVSPERLANPGFGRRVLDALTGRLGLLVIDEAHAVSDWGHDFRPDYQRIAAVLAALHPATPVLATTATANARVTSDVAAQLARSVAPMPAEDPSEEPSQDAGENARWSDDTLVLRGPLARDSLQLTVVDRLSPLERFSWVAEHLPELSGSGIVYCLTVADAERLAAVLAELHPDLGVAAYTGQLPGAERERLEDALRANKLKCLVATSALGMGYDKPDLGFVVNVGSPPSPVAYYQQVGRAGRGIDHALVVLLPSASDDAVWDYFATATIPVPEQMERLRTELANADEPLSTIALEAATGLRRTKVDLMLKQLAVDGAAERTIGGWVATGRPWTFRKAHYEGIIATRQREADIMRRYCRGEQCLMELLRNALDDPHAAPCGRCSVCLGRLPEPLRDRPQVETTRRVATVLRRDTHVLEPRKMWPGGAYGSRKKIAPDEAAEEGRVLMYMDAPEWADLAREAFGPAAGQAPDELRRVAVSALSAWSKQWRHRPQVVVGFAPGGADRLVTELADYIATAASGLTRGTVGYGVKPGPDLAGPDEAAAWRDTLLLDTDTLDEVGGRHVLLVVDSVSSTWPVTVAAAGLRSAGAASVLPLVVRQRP